MQTSAGQIAEWQKFYGARDDSVQQDCITQTQKLVAIVGPIHQRRTAPYQTLVKEVRAPPHGVF